MNIDLAEKTIMNLARAGVSEFVVCPGGRNAPLVKVLGSSTGSRVRHFYDERAAGFYALGRARVTGAPVAVVTTSGTASAELLPAAIEAFYSGVALVFVTADRPQSYRGSGSPQTIEQVGLFSHYAQPTLDLASADDVPSEFSLDKSLHLNLCFSEPLLDRSVSPLHLAAGRAKATAPLRDDSVAVTQFFRDVKKPLVILSALPASARGRVLEFVSELGAPIYAEAQSGLRECASLQELILKTGESALTAEFIGREFDGVLRIGSVPTLRLWRDLELSLAHLPVLSISDLDFSGLARGAKALPLANLFATPVHATNSEHRLLVDDAKRFLRVNRLFEDFAQAEPSYFRRLSEVIPSDDFVFVGNSLPIREWDFAASYASAHADVAANRGANGIDGLISTFFGMCSETRTNWLVLGDLSALYDLNALSFIESGKRLRIVVVNNEGGQIFKRMFNDENFLNRHHLEFSKWAEMFGFDYLTTDLLSNEPLLLGGKPLLQKSERLIVELKPSSDETEKFWAAYKEVMR